MKRQENNAERSANAWTSRSVASAPSQFLTQDDRHKQEKYEWLERMRDEEGSNGH